MAIHYRNGCRDLLVRAFTAYGQPLAGATMVEFGNQRLKFDPGEGARRLQSAKPYFEFLGIRHISIDLNGMSGALPMDLGKRISAPDVPHCCADFVTNFGTSEHVRTGQRWVFENAHNFARPGGFFVHAVPKTRTCRRHGHWKYSTEWFESLAKTNGYRIVELGDFDKSVAWEDGRIAPGSQVYVLAIMQRMNAEPFQTERWTDPMRK